jgi:hypothetical protein
MTRPSYPGGARFAFSIFDDADNATVANVAPVYRMLAQYGILTTKSVWVYPPRGPFKGESLVEADYRTWIQEIAAQGFEIGLHNVGDGPFTRAEILAGLELFREAVGSYPEAHANHVSNPDSVYWWSRRFEWPFSWLYRAIYSLFYRSRVPLGGENPASPHFWGDAFKEHIRYARNLTFNGIDTLARDPRMPYRVGSKSTYSNQWFSSSDGQTIEEMCDLLSEANVDSLEANGGACIVYTHFASGFVGDDGRVDPTFERRIAYLASKRGWFVPVSPLLDHLATQGSTDDPGYRYRVSRDVSWAIGRVGKWWRYRR